MKHLLFLFAAMLITLASFSQTVATQVTLDGSASNDADGTIQSYTWKQISGPANPTIVSPNAAVTVVKDYNTPGTYQYELTVTDNQGATGTSTVSVVVLPANQSPKASIEISDITIQLPKTQ